MCVCVCLCVYYYHYLFTTMVQYTTIKNYSVKPLPLQLAQVVGTSQSHKTVLCTV